jgi:hypothetical protein
MFLYLYVFIGGSFNGGERGEYKKGSSTGSKGDGKVDYRRREAFEGKTDYRKTERTEKASSSISVSKGLLEPGMGFQNFFTEVISLL